MDWDFLKRHETYEELGSKVKPNRVFENFVFVWNLDLSTLLNYTVKLLKYFIIDFIYKQKLGRCMH